VNKSTKNLSRALELLVYVVSEAQLVELVSAEGLLRHLHSVAHKASQCTSISREVRAPKIQLRKTVIVL